MLHQKRNFLLHSPTQPYRKQNFWWVLKILLPQKSSLLPFFNAKVIISTAAFILAMRF